MRTCLFHAGMPKDRIDVHPRRPSTGATERECITFPSFGDPDAQHGAALPVFSKRPQDLPEFKDAGL